MMNVNALDVEEPVLRDFVELVDRLSASESIATEDQNTLAILKWHASKKLEWYSEMARRRTLENELMHEIKSEFNVEKLIGYGIASVVILSVMMIIMR